MKLKFLPLLALGLLCQFVQAQAPVASISTNQVVETLESGQTKQVIINLNNSGNRDLNYTFATPNVKFRKAPFANPSLAANQDRINDQVWITRANNEGIYNAATQTEFGDWDSGSPLGTQWAWGPTSGTLSEYLPFMDLCQLITAQSPYEANCYMPIYSQEWYLENYKMVSLFVENTGEYFDVEFQKWGIGSGGGGEVEYTRYKAYKWLSIIPTTSTLTLGQSTELMLDLKTDGLIAGTYNGIVTVETNDPINPILTVNIELTITGSPQIELSKSSLFFSNVVVGAKDSLTVTIENKGAETLEITSFELNNPAFFINEEEISIPGFGFRNLTVFFNPTEVAFYEGVLTILSNDPEFNSIELQLQGSVLDAPIAFIDVTPIEIEIESGNTSFSSLQINNSGLGDLQWSVKSINTVGRKYIYEKLDYTYHTEEVPVDIISNNVHIFRDDNQGIYNVAAEEGFNRSVSPSGTLWAQGLKVNNTNLNSFTNWANAVGSPKNSVGKDYTMYLEESKTFLDVKILSWTSNNAGGGFKYQRDPNFVFLDDYQGSVSSESNSELSFQLSAQRLFAGTYYSEIEIITNDPLNSSFVIPITLHVSGNAIIESEEYYEFNTIPVGVSTTKYLEIKNVGSDDLMISNVESSDARITLGSFPTIIEPKTSGQIELVFLSSIQEFYPATITIQSNSLGSESFEIDLQVEAFNPPVIVVDNQPIVVNINANTSQELEIPIQNTGNITLATSLTTRNSEIITFSKENYADWTLESNQDRLLPNVWLTRADNRGLFNIYSETEYNSGGEGGYPLIIFEDLIPIENNGPSPKGTRWSYNSAMTSSLDNYTSWENALGANPPSAVGRTISMYDTEERRFFNFDFSAWSSNNSGGGFAYTRYETVSWLKSTNPNFEVYPNSDSILLLTINTDQLNAGTYSTTLYISTNDPLNPEIEVPITINVTGFPFVDYDTPSFGEVVVGATKEDKIRIYNTGSDVLEIQSISAPGANYSYSTNPFSINPGKFHDLAVSYSPLDFAGDTLMVTIETNAYSGAIFEIELGGIGVGSPVLSLLPENFAIDVLMGTKLDSIITFTIKNEGPSNMTWRIGGEEVDFAKPSLADWTLEQNQDRISEGVWITRQSTQGLFNIAQESSYTGTTSPLGTLWAFGETKNLSQSDYKNWIQAVNNSPGSMVNNPISLYLTEEDRYFDVLFSNYAGGGSNGAFAYKRTEVLPDWLVFSNKSGQLLPGNEIELSVTINTNNLSGDYTSRFSIFTNDLNNPQQIIPVQLQVTDFIQVSAFEDLKLDEGFESFVIGLDEAIVGVNGTSLSYSTISSNTEVVTTDVVDNQLVINEVANGQSEITLRVQDGLGRVLFIDFMVTVGPLPQTLTFNALAPITYGNANFTLNASTNSGLPISYSSSNPEVATVSGNVVSVTGAGSTIITASQLGNVDYLPAEVERELVINKATLTLTANNASRAYNEENPEFTISYNGFVYGQDESAITEQPLVTTTALIDSQVGDYPISIAGGLADNYDFTYVEGVLTIVKANQSINFAAIDNKTVGDDPFELDITTTAGLAVNITVLAGQELVSIDGTTVTILAGGEVVLAANQPGNASYNAAAQVTRSFTINKLSQTITFDAITSKTFGDAPFTINYSSNSGLAVNIEAIVGQNLVSINGTEVTILGAGTVTLEATQAGDGSYTAATAVLRNFVINKAAQTITFPAIANTVYGDEGVDLAASASSGLPISYIVLDGPAIINGGDIQLIGVGSITVRATQVGDNNYLAAANQQQSFTVAKGTITAAADAKVITYGDAIPELTITYSGFAYSEGVEVINELPEIFSSVNANSDAGVYPIVVTGGVDNNYDIITQNATITINKAAQSITASPIADKVRDAAPFTVVASSSSNLPLSYAVQGPASMVGNTLTLNGQLGQVTITISQAGNLNYLAADNVVLSFEVVPAPCDGLVVEQSAIQQVSCHNANDGSISLSITGGVEPVNILWSNGATTSTISNLAAGNYSVTVTDNVNCSKQLSFVITQPTAITVTGVSTRSAYFTNTGSVNITVTGGLSPYTFAWSNDANTKDISSLAGGNYTVTVTDASGCSVQQSFVVDVDVVGSANVLDQANLKLFPNPAQSRVQLQVDLGKLINVQLELVNTLGERVWTKNLGEVQQVDESIELRNYTHGLYLIRIISPTGTRTEKLIIK